MRIKYSVDPGELVGTFNTMQSIGDSGAPPARSGGSESGVYFVQSIVLVWADPEIIFACEFSELVVATPIQGRRKEGS
jgi:hypothetical protein